MQFNYRLLMGIFLLSFCLLIAGCENVTGRSETYGDGKDDEARLENLLLSSGELNYEFNGNDWDYEVVVPSEDETITVSPVARHIFASCTVAYDGGEAFPVESGSASLPIPLRIGKTVITVTVLAWDGSENTYTITVTRLMSDNADLESLSISAGADAGTLASLTCNETFNPATITYSAFVGAEINVLAIDARADEGTLQVEQLGLGVLDNANLGNISLFNQGANRFTIRVTAPDGVTEKLYTLQITKLSGDVADSRVTNLYIEKTTLASREDGAPFNGTKWELAGDGTHYSWTGTANDKEFDSSISLGKLNAGDNLVQTSLVIVVQSVSSRATITVDGAPTTVTNVPIASGMLSYELTQAVFPTRPASYAIACTIAPGDGNAAFATTFTIYLTVSAGNNVAALTDLRVYWGDNNSERVVYQGSFNQGSAGTTGHNPSNSATFGFRGDVTGYLAVLYATQTARLVLTPSDPNSAQIRITEVTDGGSSVETVKDCAAIVVHNVNLTAGKVTDVTIEVTAEDGTTVKSYELDLKLLNIFEYYWGIYQPISINSFERWEDKFGDQGVKSVDIPGIVHGNLDWTVTLNGLKPVNTMTWENSYLDGNRDSGGYALRTDYLDNHATDNAYNGIVFNGCVSGTLDGITSKNGLVTGDLSLSSPWGDAVSVIHTHYEVRGGQKTEMASSYVEVDYLGQTGVKIPYKTNENAWALNPFAAPTAHDWRTPWFPGTNGDFGTY